MGRDELAEMLKPLQSKTVFVHHCDKQYLPFSEGVSEQIMGRTRCFARDVAAIDKNIKVVVPKFFGSQIGFVKTFSPFYSDNFVKPAFSSSHQ